MPNDPEHRRRRRLYARAETYAGHLAANYLQGYRDGLEGEPFNMGVISLKDREHLIGYAFMEGWHDGNQDRTGRSEGGPPGGRGEQAIC